MALYLGFRLVLDVIKPESRPYLGLSGIQFACLMGLLYYARDLPRIFFGSRGGRLG
jgi:hypothetical protein